MKFKKFLIGLAIFILTIIFIVFANKAINEQPKYDSCYSRNLPLGSSTTTDYNYRSSENFYEQCRTDYEKKLKEYQQNSFITVTILSVLALVAGVLVRTVPSISWGLVFGGLIMMLFVFADNFQTIDKPYRAIVSGLALIVLIWVAYARLGDKERIAGNANEKPSNTETPVSN